MNSRESARHVVESLVRASCTSPSPPARGVVTSPLHDRFQPRGRVGRPTRGREIGRRLNWPVYDHELLEHLAKELQVDVDQLEFVDERPGHWLMDCLKAFGAVSTVNEVKYFRPLLNLLLALGAHGECVIVGRGSPFVLPADTTLCVRLLASRKDRIALIGRELALDPTQAAQYVETTDRERIRFIEDHFHKDPTDPQYYDLVLNSSRFSVVECGNRHRSSASSASPQNAGETRACIVLRMNRAIQRGAPTSRSHLVFPWG